MYGWYRPFALYDSQPFETWQPLTEWQKPWSTVIIRWYLIDTTIENSITATLLSRLSCVSPGFWIPRHLLLYLIKEFFFFFFMLSLLIYGMSHGPMVLESVLNIARIFWKKVCSSGHWHPRGGNTILVHKMARWPESIRAHVTLSNLYIACQPYVSWLEPDTSQLDEGGRVSEFGHFYRSPMG